MLAFAELITHSTSHIFKGMQRLRLNTGIFFEIFINIVHL